MKVHNVRLGHATNSSSSHSIIFDPRLYLSDSGIEEYFGWDEFTLASQEMKSVYMASLLKENLTDFPKPLVDAIIKGLGLPPPKDHEYGGSIDHQSLICLPKEFGTNYIDLQFYKEFVEYVLKDHVYILGGNDNDGEHLMYSKDKAKFENLPRDSHYNLTCRKDGDWWTIFSKDTGNRIVVSFLEEPAPYKPETPMLIDLKVTDKCSIGCDYCYQGSTPKGEHTDLSTYDISKVIAEGKVFEVAIGGGEPTEWEDLPNLLKQLHDRGVVANFTTKSVSWLEDESMANRILPYIGAFAFSVDSKSIAKVKRIFDIFRYRSAYNSNYDLNSYIKNSKLTFQIVPGTVRKQVIQWLFEIARNNGLRVTLLGFKETGRGAKFKEIAIKRSYDNFDQTQWIDLMKDGNTPHISIDTTLASISVPMLDKAEIPNWLYHIEEGKYSMYIDAVTKQYGPSSYHWDKLIGFSNIPIYALSLKEAFSTIEVV